MARKPISLASEATGYDSILCFLLYIFPVCVSCRCRGNSYSLIQLPFALYQAIKGKRFISGQFLPMFDFYGDKVMAFLLASGVGVSVEFKNFVDESIDINEVRIEFREKGDKFFDNAIIASGILLAGFTTMAIITILNTAKCTGKSF
ncbi:CASP-like protein 4D1 [Solanum tuberosum]|uniref:CASP-like protein 4D1 n=1 Tax=Solanum tuberosum TaxID=4113 RepID=UPI00073A4D54|nr:PREDICTED: CASP-like protein 4D1 [Solanum tuberosum]